MAQAGDLGKDKGGRMRDETKVKRINN